MAWWVQEAWRTCTERLLCGWGRGNLPLCQAVPVLGDNVGQAEPSAQGHSLSREGTGGRPGNGTKPRGQAGILSQPFLRLGGS